MALLPPIYLDAVVAIGFGDDPKNRSWIGTGFIFGQLIEMKENTDQKGYHLWLITNKHIFKDLHEVFIKFNSIQGTPSKDYKINLLARNGRFRWVGHLTESIDVAAIQLSPQFLEKENRLFSVIRSDSGVMNREKIRSVGIAEGDRVFVLGFPMGWVEQERQYVICRGGCIARIRDFIDGKTYNFLIDAPVFPGNSGGPVIICPSVIAIQGTNPINDADLIGIVKAYVPYTDIAVSQQTKQARIAFEENSGLAIVESVDSIIETIKLGEKRAIQRKVRIRRKVKKQQENNKV
jgi:hypothetical protein